MTWRKFDGYNETHQLVNEDGLIIGEVTGSRHQESDGWRARVETRGETQRLGRFISLDQAKRAVVYSLETDTNIDT